MLNVNLSDAKDKLSQIVKDAAETMEPVVISVHGKKEVILISIEEYNSMQQTIRILKDHELMKKIITSLQETSKHKMTMLDSSEAKRDDDANKT